MFNRNLDASYEQDRLSKTLWKKGFTFILNRKDNIVAFNLSLVLLSAEINLVTEKRGCKKSILVAYGSSYIKIVFTLLIKIISLYMQVFIA